MYIFSAVSAATLAYSLRDSTLEESISWTRSVSTEIGATSNASRTVIRIVRGENAGVKGDCAGIAIDSAAYSSFISDNQSIHNCGRITVENGAAKFCGRVVEKKAIHDLQCTCAVVYSTARISRIVYEGAVRNDRDVVVFNGAAIGEGRRIVIKKRICHFQRANIKYRSAGEKSRIVSEYTVRNREDSLIYNGAAPEYRIATRFDNHLIQR